MKVVMNDVMKAIKASSAQYHPLKVLYCCNKRSGHSAESESLLKNTGRNAGS